MPKQRTPEEMRAYQRERRGRVVTPDQAVTPDTPEAVTPVAVVTPSAGVTDRRQWLRVRLDTLKAEYQHVARDQDAHPLTAINQEREPLFSELAQLEAGMPASAQYWMPVRFSQQAAMPKA